MIERHRKMWTTILHPAPACVGVQARMPQPARTIGCNVTAYGSARRLVSCTHVQCSSLRPSCHLRQAKQVRRFKAAGAAARAVVSAAAAAVEVPCAPLTFSHRQQLYDEEGRLMLKNLTLEELEEWCLSIGEDAKRAHHLWRLMYQDNKWSRTFADAPEPHKLSQAAQAKLGGLASLSGGLTLQSVHTARDGTHKLVFALGGVEGGPAGSVETVLIPMYNRDGTQPRYTACLSTQVGCAMNCQFCYTGRMGLLGNLSAAQVVEQVVEARRWLAAYQQQQQQQQEGQLLVAGATAGSLEQAVSSSSDGSSSGSGSRGGGADADLQAQMLVARQASSVGAGTSYNTTLPTPTSSSSSTSSSRRKGSKKWPAPAPRISNIVYMGMGEPLHNLNATLPSIDILASSQGLALSRNKIIVSTVGLVPQLRELRSSGKAKLAVSLHATTDEIRSWIVPTNRKYPLAELMGALAELYPLHDPGLKRDDFVVIEYVLLKGVNDSDEDAARLLELTKDVYCMVNLIVFNPHEGTKFQRSDDEQVARFRSILIQGGKVCTLRMSKGDDEMAACGQLGDPGASPRPAPMLQPPERLKAALASA